MIAADLAVFHAVHGFGSATPALHVVSAFLATWLILLAGAAVLAALAAAWGNPPRRLEITAAAVRASAAAVLAVAGNALIGLAAFRARPFIALNIEPVIGAPITAKSFPSDHAAVAFAVAASFAFAWPRWRWAFLAVAALVAIGRVLAGVHYPSDILVGAALGTLWAWAVETVDVRRAGAFSLRIARAITRHRV